MGTRSFSLRHVAFLSAIVAPACASILGIDDRYPEEGTGEAGADSGGEGGGADGTVLEDGGAEGAVDASDADVAPPKPRCTPSECGDAGGTCVGGGTCAIDCKTSTCKAKAIACPPLHDCVVTCGEGDFCDTSSCTGGHSCTFDCSTATAPDCKTIKCQSDTCRFECGATGACGPLSCDAGLCVFECTGDTSCDQSGGLTGHASQGCSILCSGKSACGGGGGDGKTSPLRCDSPDSSIICTDVMDSCKDGIPSCVGAFCKIRCDGGACEDGVCCDASTCDSNRPNTAVLCK